MQAERMAQSILQGIELPRIPDREVSILRFGARPGTLKPQTAFIQRAIDETHAAGGGRVAVPSGRFLTGALVLKSGVEIHLAKPDSVLCFSTQTDEGEYPLRLCHWEGSPCINYSALIYALDAEDIAVTGQGALDGQAGPKVWWNWHHQMEKAWSADGQNLQNEARLRLREMNLQGVPAVDRRFGDGHFLRPNFLQFLRCRRVLLAGVTVTASPMWLVNPVLCRSITIRNMTLCSHGPNNDGVDPESCDGVLIEGCRFDTGDDCISLKSGRDRDGRELNRPCKRVLIRDNLFADGHGGIALGSEASGGIRDVAAIGNRFESENLTYALRFKSNAKRGGVMENIALSGSDIRKVGGAAISGTMLYEDGRNGELLPVFRNILIENVTARGGDYGIFLEAFPEVPITGLFLKNIAIDGVRTPLHAANWQGARLENVVINGLRYPRPTMVRILGLPAPDQTVHALARGCGEEIACDFLWEWRQEGLWREAGTGEPLFLPEDSKDRALRVTAVDREGNRLTSTVYRIMNAQPREGAQPGVSDSLEAFRLRVRGLLPEGSYDPGLPVTRRIAARLFAPLAGEGMDGPLPADILPEDPDAQAIRATVTAGLLPLREGCFGAEEPVARQEMATVAMQACGVRYQNASTTMPVCQDAAQVSAALGTNVARALYYRFMDTDAENRFHPAAAVTMGQAVCTLNAVADFAGI